MVLAIYGAGSGVTALLNIAAHIGGFQLDQTTTSLLPVVLFGVGTDYAVFLLYRYRDRLRAGDDDKTAMTAAVARIGRAMVASALAVAVSFSAMAVSGLLTFRILGPSLAVAVLAMLATSVTVVPAVLALGSRRRARSARWTRPPQHATIGRVAGLVGRRPAPVALGAVAVLAALAVAALGYHPSYDQQPYPAGSQSAAGYQELQRGYPAGALDPTVVVVTARHAPPATGQLASFAADLGQVPGVGRVTTGPTGGHGRVTELDVQLAANPESSAAFRIVRAVEAVAAARAPAGTTALAGGDTAAYYDVSNVLSRDMKVIFPLRRPGDFADPPAHFGLIARAALPDGLGGAGLRRHALRIGPAVPARPGPRRDRLPAAPGRLLVRGPHRHRLQHPDHQQAARGDVAGGVTTPGRGDSCPLRSSRGCRRRPRAGNQLRPADDLPADRRHRLRGSRRGAAVGLHQRFPARPGTPPCWQEKQPGGHRTLACPHTPGGPPASRPSSLQAATPWN